MASGACYVLMEDKKELAGRCMTLPHPSSSSSSDRAANGSSTLPPRTATFSAPLSTASPVAVETETEKEKEDIVPPLPAGVSKHVPLRSRVAKTTGILRRSVSADEGGAPRRKTRQVKKQVSIALPDSSGHVVPSRRRKRRSTAAVTIPEDVDETSGGLEEVVVQAEVHSNSSEENTASDEHVLAVHLLNRLERDEEANGEDVIILRDGTQSCKRKSVRESLTNSLSRIGNRMRRGKPPKLQRLQSALDFDKLAQNELELKANLYWHIATPIKRWKVERQVPIKLVLQLLKTLCLIVQVILFTGTIAHKRGEFFFDSRVVFESLFKTNFDPETVLQQRTLYSVEEVTREIDFIAYNYYRLPDVVIGGYDNVRDNDDQPVPIQFNLRQYRTAILNASDSQYILDGHVDEFNFNYTSGSASGRLFEVSGDPRFHKFLDLRVRMPVNVIRIEAPQKAECYRFNVEINFVNDDHNGKILYDLRRTYSRISNCRGDILYDDKSYDVIMGALLILNLIVLMFCLVSLYLTAKTLHRAYRLGKAMGQFYDQRLNLPLSWRERSSLFSSWHYINILSDLLITAGTIDKILLEYDVVLDASVARILLGTALLFQAAVILRYINYFKQVNALTRTLALAFPELVKFLLCGAVLFFAFALCGWIVLGPFHPKFTDFNDTVETLFSLLNGDDIYNTYILLDPEVDLLAYIYSRIFLYVFLGLFIYAVLNLFTSLIIVAHEISQDKDTAMGNEVRRFVFSGPLTPRGVALRDVTSTSKYVDPALILNKTQRKRKNSSDDDS